MTLTDEDLKEVEDFATKQAMRFKRESGNTLDSVCARGHDAAVDAILGRGGKVEDYKISPFVTRNFHQGPTVEIKVRLKLSEAAVANGDFKVGDGTKEMPSEIERLRLELEQAADLCHVTDEAHNRTLELLAKTRWELRQVREGAALSRIARLVLEKEELQKHLPDHCYRCERPCRYAGAETRTGASRCAECLLEDAKAEIEDLRAGKHDADEAQKEANRRLKEVTGNMLNERAESRKALILQETESRKEIDLLTAVIESFSCSQHSSFNHAPEQWRMCQACSAKSALRGEGQQTRTPCSVHKGFKEDCGCD